VELTVCLVVSPQVFWVQVVLLPLFSFPAQVAGNMELEKYAVLAEEMDSFYRETEDLVKLEREAAAGPVAVEVAGAWVRGLPLLPGPGLCLVDSGRTLRRPLQGINIRVGRPLPPPPRPSRPASAGCPRPPCRRA
jgi:hypothetical protein